MFGSQRPPKEKSDDEEYSDDDDEPPENNHYLKYLEKLDISECALIQTSGMLAMAEACGDGLKEFKASNCQLAINNETVTALANLPG